MFFLIKKKGKNSFSLKPIYCCATVIINLCFLTDQVAAIEKDIAQRKLLSAWTFFSPVDISFEDYKKRYRMEVKT